MGEDWHHEHICVASTAGCVGGVSIETRACYGCLYRVLILWKLEELREMMKREPSAQKQPKPPTLWMVCLNESCFPKYPM